VDFIKGMFAGAIALCSVTVANATPISWVDTIDFNPDRYIAPNSSVSYNHDILDNGYTPLVDSIYGYSLSVNLYDDGDNGLEVALVNVPGVGGDKVYFDLSGSEFGGWSLAGYGQLALTGLYDVTISSLWGDFFLGSSTLTVRGDERSVPEPGALGLLALAMLGMVAASRRKRGPLAS
jgi:hypothetical protein